VDDLTRADQEARKVARNLRDLTLQLTDAPSRDAWWKLRKHLRGVYRWRHQVGRATSRAPHDHAVWIGLSALDAAVTQAQTALRDLGRDYDSRAGYGVGSRSRPNPDAARGSRVFTARFDGTCSACGLQLHRGEPARFDADDRIRHDQCPTQEAADA
jgi:rRNA maturation protein Nop10